MYEIGGKVLENFYRNGFDVRYLILNLWIILLLPSAGWASSEVAVLEAAVKAAPKDGDAWVVLGNVYLNAGGDREGR